MIKNTKDYIILERKDKDEFGDQFNQDNRHSWKISFNKNKGYFFCKNLSTKNVTKMKNIKNFIRVWIRYSENKSKNNINHKALIRLFVQKEFVSQYTCSFKDEIPKYAVSSFVSLLKNII